MSQALLQRLVAPGENFYILLAFSLEAFGKFHQSLGRGGLSAIFWLAIEQHVLHSFKQLLGNIRINTQLASVDDAHGHAGPNRVIEESGMDRFPHGLIATEGEGYIGHTATYLRVGQDLLDEASGLD